MGLVITPRHTPLRFDPLNQPLPTLQNLGGRELVWRFDGGDITSDGGALLLKKLEERTGIVRRFAACFPTTASPDLIEHPLLDLIMQRVFGLALGYEDLNDHDELRRDPMLAVALSKDDVKGEHTAARARSRQSLGRKEHAQPPGVDGAGLRRQSPPEGVRQAGDQEDCGGPGEHRCAAGGSVSGSARAGARADHSGCGCHR